MDRLLIANFFNNSGYVLDFSIKDLSGFSLNVIGEDIKTPDLSSGKSLTQFLQTAPEYKVLKLTKALMKYFDTIYEKREEALSNKNKQREYKQIQEIIKKCSINEPLLNKFDKHKLLNNEYLKKITKSMINQADIYPADSIGKSKDLLEAVLKRILENLKIEYKKEDGFPRLSNKVMKALGLKPKSKSINPTIDDISGRILGNFDQVVINMNVLRNYYGTGHGKGRLQSGEKAIPTRYAHLAIGAASTATLFLVETYYEKGPNYATNSSAN